MCLYAPCAERPPRYLHGHISHSRIGVIYVRSRLNIHVGKSTHWIMASVTKGGHALTLSVYHTVHTDLPRNDDGSPLNIQAII